VPDYVEEQDGTAPDDPESFKDSDGDGVPDYVEDIDGTDPDDPSDFKDTDGDGVPDYVEEQDGTDPEDPNDFNDADGDGVPDYVEEQANAKVKSISITNAPVSFSYKAAGNNTVQLGASVATGSATATSSVTAAADALTGKVTWKSSNENIAFVSANGLVTFKGPEGDVSITATSADDPAISATKAIKTFKNVTGIRTPLSKIYVSKGKSLTIPVVLDDNTDYKATVASKLTWTSAKPKVVTVSQSGKVKVAKKLKKKTNVKVTVTAADGRSKTITVVAVPKATKIRSVKTKFPKKMKVGATKVLKIKLKKATSTGVKVTFKSSKKSVIRVDKAGKMFALKKGTATVTVKAGNKKYKKKIKVK
jgi:uncharacterized protein YjdB